MKKLLLIFLLTPTLLLAGVQEDNWGRFNSGLRSQVMEDHKVTFITCYFSGVSVPREAIQIDHVVPIEVAERLGALSWGKDKRRAFYNDPINLVPVIAGLNSAKGSKSPKDFMPTVNKEDYLERWEVICTNYKLDCSQEF